MKVEDLYTGLLGREADSGGLAYWKGQFGDTVDANEIATFKSVANQVQPGAIDTQIKSYVSKNIDNPQAIADAASNFGVSKIDLMNATGYDSGVIDNYFASSGVVNKPMTATAQQLAGITTELGLDPAIAQMRAAGIADSEINSYLEQAAIADAQSKIDQFNANKQFADAQAELDAMSQREMDAIRKQQADFEAAQQRLAEQAAAQAAAAKAEQERLAAEAAAYQKQAEEKAAQMKKESEDFQRTNAEKDVARKRAGRSTSARPLLAGAGLPDSAPTLGVGGGMATGGSLGSTGTLGVG